MKILVTGDRAWTDVAMIYHVLDHMHVEQTITGVVHGQCHTKENADKIAGRWARSRGVLEFPMPADWNKYHRAAGPIRNQEMLDKHPDIARCVAFHRNILASAGTRDIAAPTNRSGGLVWFVYNRQKETHMSPVPTPTFTFIPVASIMVVPGWNPRFDFGDMAVMASLVKEHGVKNPFWVKPIEGGKYKLIDGGRRFAAVEMAIKDGAKIDKVPAQILDASVSDADALVLAMTANEAKPLNPLEEAGGYKRLVTELKCSVVELAKKLGRSEAHIKDRLSLLSAAPAVRDALAEGRVGSTLAERIVSHTADHKEQAKLVEHAASGREGKRQVSQQVTKPTRSRAQPAPESLQPTDALMTLEMGTLADLTVHAQGMGLAAKNLGALADEDVEMLMSGVKADPGNELYFRLGALQAFRASRGKPYNLNPTKVL